MTPETHWSPDWIREGTEYVMALTFSPDGATLAVAQADGFIRHLEATTGTCLWEREAHEYGVATLAFSPDGGFLLSGGQDGLIRQWSVESGHQTAEYIALGHWAEHLVWSPDGQCWAVSAGRQIQAFRADGQRLWLGPEQASTVTGLAWLEDSQHLLTTCYGGIRLFRVGGREIILQHEWKASFIALALSPDCRHVAGGCQDASMIVCDLLTKERLIMSGYAGKVANLAWDDHSRYLASSGNNEIIVWDFADDGPSGSTPLTLDRHVDRLSDLAFRPGTSQLASAGQDGLLILWQIADARIIRFHSTPQPLSRLAWHPRGQALAIGTADGEVRLLRNQA